MVHNSSAQTIHMTSALQLLKQPAACQQLHAPAQTSTAQTLTQLPHLQLQGQRRRLQQLLMLEQSHLWIL
jgi:hypothetical protein